MTYPYRLRQIERLPESDTYAIKIESRDPATGAVPGETKHLMITRAELDEIADVVREDGRPVRPDVTALVSQLRTACAEWQAARNGAGDADPFELADRLTDAFTALDALTTWR